MRKSLLFSAVLHTSLHLPILRIFSEVGTMASDTIFSSYKGFLASQPSNWSQCKSHTPHLSPAHAKTCLSALQERDRSSKAMLRIAFLTLEADRGRTSSQRVSWLEKNLVLSLFEA